MTNTKQITDAPAWRSRGYLPHFDSPGLIQSVTFRLRDAVPAKAIASWREDLGLLASIGRLKGQAQDDDGATREQELIDRIARYEDAGHGACWLRIESIARLTEGALRHFDDTRYQLLAWCVMTNHVHALLETVAEHSLDAVVHSWKSFTAREANRILKRTGPFWMPDYYDRFIRNQQHLLAAVAYIENNPVTGGLVQRPEDWRFSSAVARQRAEA